MADRYDPPSGTPTDVIYAAGRAIVTMRAGRVVQWEAPKDAVDQWARSHGLSPGPPGGDGMAEMWS